jgi:rhomboid protease GluP
MNLLRTIARDLRDAPATAFFCLSWVAVFVAMVTVGWVQSSPPSWWQFLVLGCPNAHRFGELSLSALGQGEIWRLITCNFVHYSLLHVVLNLIGFFILGSMIESWYGSSQFLMLFTVTGGLGNLVSALSRFGLGVNPHHVSGGGSVVVMGLIGLLAVVGWRSRHSWEGELLRPILMTLVLTGILGISLPRYIDNWGHAGGLAVGLPLGLADRYFLRNRYRPSAWGMGMISGLIIASCAMAQWFADLRERPLREQYQQQSHLISEELVYRNLRSLPSLTAPGSDARLLVVVVDDAGSVLDHGETRSEYRRLRELAHATESQPLSEDQRKELTQHAASLAATLRKQLTRRLRDYWDEREHRQVQSRHP